jgi:glycosyltransferase involved in cell wall biosynthesis
MGDSEGARPKVSVVVPVYNPGDRIRALVRSLEEQTMPAGDFEVVFVDDGSTDGTGELLDQLAATHPHFRVEHIPNSGWPGRPRNLGIELACGEYVAFVDHDDYLAVDGLQLVHDFAREHGSDVVVAREVGVGRRIAGLMFLDTVPDARLDRDPLVRLLTPHKVYRKELLDRYGIRFPEGRVRLEDHLFNMQVYFAARKVSILSDPYYYWTLDEEAAHASRGEIDPHDYFDVALNRILDVVDQHTEPGQVRDRMKSHWMERKVLNSLGGLRMLEYPPDYRRVLFDTVRRLTAERFPEQTDVHLSLSGRARAHLLRAGDLAAMVELAALEADISTTVEPGVCGWEGRDLVIEYRVALTRRDGAPLAFRQAAGGRLVWEPGLRHALTDAPDSVLEASADLAEVVPRLVYKRRDAHEEHYVGPVGCLLPEPAEEGDVVHLVSRCRAVVPVDQLPGVEVEGLRSLVDFSSELDALGWRSVRRLPAPAGWQEQRLPADPGLARVYATNKGNLSLELRPRPASRAADEQSADATAADATQEAPETAAGVPAAGEQPAPRRARRPWRGRR